MKEAAKEFEDQYGILKLVAAQLPADEAINRILRRFRNFLERVSGNDGTRSVIGLLR